MIPSSVLLDIKREKKWFRDTHLHEDTIRLESEGGEDQAEEASAGGAELDIGVGGVASVGRASLGGATGGAANGAGSIGWRKLVRAI